MQETYNSSAPLTPFQLLCYVVYFASVNTTSPPRHFYHCFVHLWMFTHTFLLASALHYFLKVCSFIWSHFTSAWNFSFNISCGTIWSAAHFLNFSLYKCLWFLLILKKKIIPLKKKVQRISHWRRCVYLFNATIVKTVEIFLKILHLSISLRAQGKS